MRKWLVLGIFLHLFFISGTAQNEGQVGKWSNPIGFGIVPVAVANLPDGKLICWSSQFRDTFIVEGDGATYTELFDPFSGSDGQALGEFTANTNHDMFCPGINNLSDGRILSAGGTSSPRTSIYDPSTGLWSVEDEMNIPRGYQGNVTLTDGSVFTLGGSWSGGPFGNRNAEIWTPQAGWNLLPGIEGGDIFTSNDLAKEDEGIYRVDNHLWLWVAPDGNIFHAGPSEEMHWINTDGGGSIISAGFRSSDTYSMKGTTVMFDIGKVLKVGGAESYASEDPAKNNSYVIDINGGYGSSPTVTPTTNNLTFSRTMHNSTVLPNGEVLVTGGLAQSLVFNDFNARLTAEIYNPQTNSWRNVAGMQIPRTYHSVGILMIDGRVFVGGGGLCGDDPNCNNHFDAEIYSPPYLFNGDGSLATRPVIDAQDNINYNSDISVSATQDIQEFSVVRFSSATHSTNNEQRRIPLNFNGSSGNYTVSVPDKNLLPPGYYMLFGLNTNGVPSVAEVVLIGEDVAQDCVFGGQELSAQYRINNVWCDTANGLPCGLNELTLDEGTDFVLSALPDTGVISITLPDGQVVPNNYNIPSLDKQTHEGIYSITASEGCTIFFQLTITDPLGTCADQLENDEALIVLPLGSFEAGLDGVVGTSVNVNGSACALEVTNTDTGEPWSRYRVALDLAFYGISPGDDLQISIDGNSGTGAGRFELALDNTPNTSILDRTFGAGWSTEQGIVTVPGGITTLDLWLFSNYASDVPGTAYYDNLSIVNLSATGGNQLPLANAGIDQGLLDTDSSGSEPVVLDGSGSSDGDGTIVSYSWAENGLVIGTGVSPTVDLSVGVHTIILTVTDDGGATDTDTVEITITPVGNELPLANAGTDQSLLDTDSSGSEPVVLDGSGSSDADGTIVSYSWAENGLVIGTGVSPTVDLSVGVHTIILTVTDDGGATDTDTVVVTITDPLGTCADQLENDEALIVLPLGSFEAGLDGVVGTSVNVNGSACALEVTNTDTGEPWSRYRVALDLAFYGISPGDDLQISIDGNSGTGAGRFELALDNTPNTSILDRTFGAGWSTEQGIVTVPGGITTLDLWLFSNYASDVPGTAYYDNLSIVNLSATGGNQLPLANAGIDQGLLDTDSSGSEPVVLDGSGSSDGDGTIVSYSWAENGLVIGTGVSPTVDLSVGVHTIILTVTDDGGATDTDTVEITITPVGNELPLANAGTDQSLLDTDSSGSEPVVLDGSGSSDADGTIVSYSWAENGLVIGTGVSPTVDLSVGVHTIILTVTDDGGATDTDTVVVTITDPLGTCADQLENDEALIVLPLGSFEAGLDGVVGTSVNVNGSACALEVTNTDTGEPWSRYRVALDLAFYGISPGDDLQISIDGNSGTGAGRFELALDNTPNTSILDRTFGAGWSTEQGIVTVPGGITTLDLWLFSNYASDVPGTAYYDNLSIVNLSATGGNQLPLANAGIDQGLLDTDSSGSEPVVLDGSGSSDGDGTIVSYSWAENGLVIGTGVSPTVDLSVGVHTIILTVTDDGGATDTDTVEITITPVGNELPLANAGTDQSLLDTDSSGSEPVVLDGSGSSDADGTIVSYSWAENGLVIGTGVSPTVDLSVGVHTIILTVTDDGGATDTDTVVVTITDPLGTCADQLENDEALIVLPLGSFEAGLDGVVGTSVNVNGSACALEVTNTDTGEPWSRYRVALDLAFYGISPGDDLQISIDGNSGTGAGRFELALDNTPNTSILDRTFGAGWSTEQGIVTVPGGITTLDLWLFSNYASDVPGTAYYDNLSIVNLSATGGNQTILSSKTSIGVSTVNESNNRQESNMIALSPNPAATEVVLSIEENINVGTIRVFDISGRLIKTIKEKEFSNSLNLILNVRSYQTGIYYLIVSDKEGRNYQKQMIINRN